MSYGLYIHLPFCRSKCPYCGFTSSAGKEDMIEAYSRAASLEINRRYSGIFAEKPQTIYIGGGTPSIVPSSFIRTIIDRFMPIQVSECTVEANPDSLDDSWLDDMLKTGVNRISIGVQSLDDRILDRLGRIHSAVQAKEAVLRARKAGFKNVSVDLMFGVPGQTMSIWRETLSEIAELEPEHVSGYSLSIEEDSSYFEISRRKGLNLPDPSETSDMYFFMTEFLEDCGNYRYEISNFARSGFECRHNMAYWDFTPYLGIGASAHSFDGSVRRWNESGIDRYVERCLAGSDPVLGTEIITDEKRALETVMLSLRTRKGLPPDKIVSLNKTIKKKLCAKIDMLIESGFLEKKDDNNIRLTEKGAVISEELIAEIAVEIL